MLTIEYNHTDLEEMLKHFAKAFNTKLKDNFLYFPKEYGEGYIRLIQFSSGLQALVSDYVTHDDILFQRIKNDKKYLNLRFDEVTIPGDTTNKSAVFLMSTGFDKLFYSNKSTKVKAVEILFNREWMENFLGVEEASELIKKYLSLKMSSFNYEPMDSEYKRVLSEITNADKVQLFEMLVIKNRIMLLMERFFTRIYKKMNDAYVDVKVSTEDIQRLVEVESELVKDYSMMPPGIAKLSRMAAMSPSKLKNVFKEIYGLPIYQYYQKHRMNKAKAMLLSQKYNVKEVGMEVGYTNLSNFAKAFKKSFDQLPSDLLV